MKIKLTKTQSDIVKLIAVIHKQDEALKFYADDENHVISKDMSGEKWYGGVGFVKARQTREEVKKMLDET